MAIRKQEFYEGAALYQLVRNGVVAGIQYEAPFFLLNGMYVLLKYSTKNRSPWGFTFGPDEQALLHLRSLNGPTVVGLVCGADGIAAIHYSSFAEVASARKVAVHIACYRRHGEHYEVSGPDGTLPRKVPPSRWQQIVQESKP